VRHEVNINSTEKLNEQWSSYIVCKYKREIYLVSCVNDLRYNYKKIVPWKCDSVFKPVCVFLR
jgi:hypothetical protein